MPLSAQRLRLPFNADQIGEKPKDILTGNTPRMWRGANLRVEATLFKGKVNAEALQDLSNIASLTLEVFALSNGAPTGAALMSQTVAAVNLDTGLTLSEWQADNGQHALFEFDDQDTNLNLSGAAKVNFWLVLSALTQDSPAKLITLGATTLTVYEDGTPASAEGPVQGGNILPGGASYDGSGDYVLSGLTVNRVYKWSPGANDTTLVNGAQTLTEEGNFTAQGTSATLTGTPSAAVTAIVREDVYLNAQESDARYLKKLRGAYAGGTQYYEDDLVTDQGGIWLALQDTIGNAPPTLPTTSNANWLLVVAPGEDGAQGPAGADGADGEDGDAGAAGADGEDAYMYVGFAEDASGTGFATTPSASRPYIAFKASATALTPVAGDFAGLWVKYIGDDGQGNGDMILAAVQTVTGAKTFSNGTLRIRNAAGTFNAVLRSLVTAERDIYLPDRAGTLATAPVASTLTYQASMALDFSGDEWKSVNLTGDAEFTTLNRAAGKLLVVRVICDDTTRALTFPSGWTWLGEAPRNLPASTEAILRLWCFGTTDETILAEWRPESGATSYQAETVTAAGSTAVQAPTGAGVHTLRGTVTDTYDGTAFTHAFYFPTTKATEGDRIFARIALPGSTDPTIEFRNDTAGGTILLAVQGVMLSSELWADFVYTGSAWVLEKWGWFTDDGAAIQNLHTRETLAYAAAHAVDLDRSTWQEMTLTGDLAITTRAASRAGAGRAKTVHLILLASGSDRTITLDGDILPIGTAPGVLPAGKTGILTLTSRGAAETDTLATWEKQA